MNQMFGIFQDASIPPPTLFVHVNQINSIISKDFPSCVSPLPYLSFLPFPFDLKVRLLVR